MSRNFAPNVFVASSVPPKVVCFSNAHQLCALCGPFQLTWVCH